MKFEPGMVVQLKSGAPKLTLVRPACDGSWYAIWFDAHGLHTDLFDTVCLKVARED